MGRRKGSHPGRRRSEQTPDAALPLALEAGVIREYRELRRTNYCATFVIYVRGVRWINSVSRGVEDLSSHLHFLGWPPCDTTGLHDHGLP